MKILYTCAWEKKKEKTWSGTTYSLFKALKRNSNVCIKECDMALNKYEKVLVNLINNKINGKDLKLQIYQKKINKIDTNKEDVILQIGSYGVCRNTSYIYQDLNYEALLYYQDKKPKLFEHSNYQHISKEELCARYKKQMELYKNSQGIFTMGKWLADILYKNGNIPKEKIHHVGAGININVNNIKRIPKNNNKILFVGRDFYRKGGDITYKAFKILKERYNKNAELYIAGPKEYPLSEKIDGVNFLGELEFDELSKYFNMCDIFCLPSRFEAYGLVFIEALVYGMPCIGRNEFSMKEFIQDGYNGYLVEDDDEEVLAYKMSELLKNEKIKNNVITNRDKYIKTYSWDTVAEKMIEIIKKDYNDKNKSN